MLITNPINPINPNPIAETFATVVNSFLEGFFKSFHTLVHWLKNDLMLNMFLIEKKGLKDFGKVCIVALAGVN